MRTQGCSTHSTTDTVIPSNCSFANFCRDFGVKYLCDRNPTKGDLGWGWNYYCMKILDMLISCDSSEGKPTPIFVTEHETFSGKFGAGGHPVIRFNGQNHIMLEVRFSSPIMYVKCALVTDDGITYEEKEIDTCILRSYQPQMIGIANWSQSEGIYRTALIDRRPALIRLIAKLITRISQR